MKVVIVCGTRPEVIKLAPLYHELKRRADVCEVRCIATGQHEEMLSQALIAFGITPDVQLQVMRKGQALNELASRLLTALDEVIKIDRPDICVVQGDTTSALTAALCSFHLSIPVAHVEAGLRSGDMLNPFPEEMNRVVIARLATYHFAPSGRAAAHLRREGVAESKIYETGNTVVDALRIALNDASVPTSAEVQQISRLSGKKLLVTLHRRESHGMVLQNIFQALRELATQHPALSIIIPVHPNPAVSDPAHKILSSVPGVKIIKPQDYHSFVRLMQLADVILSDSGGVQEEAAYLGKFCLVARMVTDRPETLESGHGKLIGVASEKIIAEVNNVLAGNLLHHGAGDMPYGRGDAAVKIADILLRGKTCALHE